RQRLDQLRMAFRNSLLFGMADQWARGCEHSLDDDRSSHLYRASISFIPIERKLQSIRSGMRLLQLSGRRLVRSANGSVRVPLHGSVADYSRTVPFHRPRPLIIGPTAVLYMDQQPHFMADRIDRLFYRRWFGPH